MSKLTSFTSASDALIQPTGATEGQTLTWNATTGQFEPTTPSTTPANSSITSAMIVEGTIVTADLADSSVTGNKIAPGTITFDNIADGTIIGSKLQNGGITAAKMGVDSITSANIVDGTIQNEDVGTGQIGLDKLAPIPTTSLVGLGVGGSPAAPTNITLGTNLSFSGNVLNAAGGGGDSSEFPNWLPNTDYLAGDAVMMSSVTWGSWYMRRNAPGTSGAVLDVTELGQWIYVGQVQTFNWQPNQLVPQGLKIVESNRYWERLSSGITQPAGLGFDNTEQANWLALTPVLPAPLPTFSSGAALMGNGTNIPEADARVTFVGGSGGSGITVSASGTGTTVIGNAGTGNIAIGTASTTRLTTLNGIVKRPNMATLYTTGVGQTLTANGAAAVNWNAAIITIGSGITVSGTAITLSRTGIYRVYGGISITSATVNTRGIIAPVAGTAAFASPSAKAVRQTTANIATENSYEFLLNVTTAGTFSIGCTMVAASSIQAFNSTTTTAATTTLYIQEIG